MKKVMFIVGGTKVVRETEEHEIVAYSREQAIETFKQMFPGHPVDFVQAGQVSWEVQGQDEITGEYIFEGDDYVVDSDGIYILRKNLPPDGE